MRIERNIIAAFLFIVPAALPAIAGDAALAVAPAAVEEAVPAAPPVLLIDSMNVIGTRPDGWWRDRDAAAVRFFGRLRCYAGAEGVSIIAVFDGFPPADLPEGDYSGVRVIFAFSDEPDASDDRIVAIVEALDEPARAEVVTSDRDLIRQVRELGAAVTSSSLFLERLDKSGC